MAGKRSVITSVVLLAAALLAAIQARPASAATSAASVTVSATAGLGTVPAHAIGLNTAVYDGDMNDAAMPALLKAAGVDALTHTPLDRPLDRAAADQMAAAGRMLIPTLVMMEALTAPSTSPGALRWVELGGPARSWAVSATRSNFYNTHHRSNRRS